MFEKMKDMNHRQLNITEGDLIKNFKLYDIPRAQKKGYDQCIDKLNKLMKIGYKQNVIKEILKKPISERDEIVLSAISQSRLDCERILEGYQK